MNKTRITKVWAREILDSRGNPTVEAEVTLEDGTVGRGQAPSGASTGKFEACELRDNDGSRYMGKGVLNAVNNVRDVIAPVLKDREITDLYKIDKTMIALDGTKDKSKLGANGILAVSLACADAGAKAVGMQLFKFIGGAFAGRMPVPMMNILNGGAHASNGLDVQEFMIMPVGAKSFSQGLQWCSEVFHTLAKILKHRNLSTAVGDEGGFAPEIKTDYEAIELIIEAITSAGFKVGSDFVLALDAAASEWKSNNTGEYILPKSGEIFTSDQLISHWESLCNMYPIRSIEDPLDEEDWQGWKYLTQKLGSRIQLVGDDLFVTNTERLSKGINENSANAILIKLNQIGTVSETIEAVRMAQKNGYKAVMSHRSGETESTAIADLAVALNVGQIKTGAPSRSERTAKYNQLLRIEEDIFYSDNDSYGDCF